MVVSKGCRMNFLNGIFCKFERRFCLDVCGGIFCYVFVFDMLMI